MERYTSKRHKDLAKRLMELGYKRQSPTKDNERIAKKLRISSTTVFYYVCGKVTDGFLGEAILEELKNGNS